LQNKHAKGTTVGKKGVTGWENGENRGAWSNVTNPGKEINMEETESRKVASRTKKLARFGRLSVPKRGKD